MNGKKKKTNPVGQKIAMVILIIALCVFVFAGIKLYKIWKEYHAGTVEYKAVAEEVLLDEPEAGVEIDPTDRGSSEERDMLPAIDWDALLNINPDVCAWLYFQEPEIINYPVTFCEDNEYYLHHTVEKTYLFSGCLFVDMNNSRDVTDANTIIYGHAMNNGAMFGELDRYLREDFFNRNQYFYLETPDGGVYRYQVLAFYETVDQSESYRIGFSSRDEYAEYLEKMAALSMYPSQAQIDPDSPLLTLSTCTNRTEDGRYLLQGILVDVLKEGSAVRKPLSWE